MKKSISRDTNRLIITSLCLLHYDVLYGKFDFRMGIPYTGSRDETTTPPQKTKNSTGTHIRSFSIIKYIQNWTEHVIQHEKVHWIKHENRYTALSFTFVSSKRMILEVRTTGRWSQSRDSARETITK